MIEREYRVRANCPYVANLYYAAPHVWTPDECKAKRFSTKDEAAGVALATYDHFEYGTSVEEA